MDATTEQPAANPFEGEAVYGLESPPINVHRCDPSAGMVTPADVGLRVFSGLKIPALGDRVRINFNQLGTGAVSAYFHEHGWVGVEVKLDDPPAWHRKQHKGTKHDGYALVFGREIVTLEQAARELAAAVDNAYPTAFRAYSPERDGSPDGHEKRKAAIVNPLLEKHAQLAAILGR